MLELGVPAAEDAPVGVEGLSGPVLHLSNYRCWGVGERHWRTEDVHHGCWAMRLNLLAFNSKADSAFLAAHNESLAGPPFCQSFFQR